MGGPSTSGLGRYDTRIVAVLTSTARVLILAVVALGVSAPARGADKAYAVKGMVLSVEAATRTFVVSHEKIAGLMDAMVMPFEVRDAKELQGLVPGAVVEFTLLVGDRAGYATQIEVRRYESVEQDPVTARRLGLLKRIAGGAPKPLTIGSRVPNFTLTDQTGRPVSLAALAGKVVALNFIYTRCALPQFCLRVTNNFGVLQKRFERQLGRDLVLLTVTFDPERDTPDVLAKYAERWKPDPKAWHFLTGDVDAVRRVCGLFGVEAFPDEGLMNHSLRTAVVDRSGVIVASIEGNQYTPEQLGDLVQAALKR
jgi:protein SCO1